MTRLLETQGNAFMIIPLIKLQMSKPNNYGNFKNNLICKNNPLDPIFVPTFRQTMQKAYQQPLIQSRLSQKRTSLSFSEYSKNVSNIQLYKNIFFIKQEIKPHQSKPLNFKISQLIKSSLSHSKTFSNIQDKGEAWRDPINKSKKSTSYSAYVHARKKLCQKKNSFSSVTQTQSKDISFSLKLNSQLESKGQNSFMIEDNFGYMKRKNGEKADQICVVDSQNQDKKSKYLQKLIFRSKKSQIVKQQRLKMLSPRLEGQFKTQALKNGFLKLIKKRKKQESLMISMKKKSVSEQGKHQKMDQLQNIFLKFPAQKSVEQEDIQLAINHEQIVISREGLKKQIFQTIFSKAVTILEVNKNTITNLYSLEEKSKLQIASITKIMTCYLIILISESFNLNIRKEKVIISEKASKMQGTSAKLAYSDVCTVIDLLHGLMLPSGNDAAIALGQWGGKTIRRYSLLLKRQRQSLSPTKCQKSLNFLSLKRKSNVRLFVLHMNRLAKQLKLKNTHFANTHGLMNEKAYSCSQDISILTYFTMKNKTFREIVSKKDYNCKISNRTFSFTKDVQWQNTNKLLSVEGFVGTKTGVTPSAGPCLTSVFQLSQNHYFIITILNTKSCEMRFKQTVKLLKVTFQALKESQDKVNLYQNALAKLQQYDRLQIHQDDRQMVNNMLQSTSQSDKQQEEHSPQQRLVQYSSMK